MVSQTKRVIVAGGTGMVGRQIIRRLLDQPDGPEVTALARRPLPIPKHPRLEERTVDFERDDPFAPGTLAGADAVLCALGTTIKKAGSEAAFRRVDHDAVLALARAARRDGVATFVVVSSVGASRGSGNLYLRVKGEMEAAVGGLGLPAVYVLRPGLLLGARDERRPGEAIARAAAPVLGALMVGPLRKYRGIEADTVAAAAVAAARDGRPGFHVWHNDEIAGAAA